MFALKVGLALDILQRMARHNCATARLCYKIHLIVGIITHIESSKSVQPI